MDDTMIQEIDCGLRLIMESICDFEVNVMSTVE